MDCLVLPVCLLRKRSSTRSRLGYRPLKSEEDGYGEAQVTVVVGKQKREFLVDRFVLEKSPFRVLIETMKKGCGGVMDGRREKKKKKKVIFVDVDDILFEHMLWLMNNDRSSLFQLNLEEIIDFYAQDY